MKKSLSILILIMVSVVIGADGVLDGYSSKEKDGSIYGIAGSQIFLDYVEKQFVLERSIAYSNRLLNGLEEDINLPFSDVKDIFERLTSEYLDEIYSKGFTEIEAKTILTVATMLVKQYSAGIVQGIIGYVANY